MGGYVGASNTSNDGDQPTAEITYRIPADRWEDALDLLRGLNGLTTKVVTEHTEAVEVTGQVIDLQARIVWLPILVALGALAAGGAWLFRRFVPGRGPEAILPPAPPSEPAASGG